MLIHVFSVDYYLKINNHHEKVKYITNCSDKNIKLFDIDYTNLLNNKFNQFKRTHNLTLRSIDHRRNSFIPCFKNK